MPYHEHNLGKGSMKIAHELDDRQDRATMGNSKHDTQTVKPISTSKAQSIYEKIEATRLAMRQQDQQNRTTKY